MYIYLAAGNTPGCIAKVSQPSRMYFYALNVTGILLFFI